MSRADEAVVSRCGCGFAVPHGARYCRRCGAPTEPSSAVATAVPDRAAEPAHEPELPRPRIAQTPPSLTGSRLREGGLQPRIVRASELGIPEALPDVMSARQTLTAGQRTAIRLFATALAIGLVVDAVAAATALVAVATGAYIAAFLYRAHTYWQSFSSPGLVSIEEASARQLWAYALPIYTVLVPAYREPEVIRELIGALNRLEYPRERLDIKILLEEDDGETLAAAIEAWPGPWVEIVVVPDGTPKTKPRACNYGLARARGKFVTIFDAEDKPEPLQLRRAVAAFRRVDASIACLQAKLVYHNADQNIITKWFATEYLTWFSHLLPGLVKQGVPLPLGGTSNHFRVDVLRKVGAWDPHNVTEDADLGIRLHRAGHRTQVLDSITLEEANSDFINWVKQRSRWYKGYMQTWLIHMRNPGRVIRETGVIGFLGLNLFVGGTPFLALLNPVFWVMTIVWFIGRPEFIAAIFPSWLYYAGLFCLVAGNFTFFYTALVSARSAGRPSLVVAALGIPIYWVMMSVAAIKALVQLIHAPSFWEKTVHGLDRRSAAETANAAQG